LGRLSKSPFRWNNSPRTPLGEAGCTLASSVPSDQHPNSHAQGRRQLRQSHERHVALRLTLLNSLLGSLPNRCAGSVHSHQRKLGWCSSKRLPLRCTRGISLEIEPTRFLRVPGFWPRVTSPSQTRCRCHHQCRAGQSRVGTSV
jgi:hypothetical protein